MTQYINLLNPALRPRREALSANALAVSLAVVFAALLGLQSFTRQRADALEAESKQLSAQSKAEQEALTAAEKAASESKLDARLATALEEARDELRKRETAMKALSGGMVGNTEGFSELFRALARQSMNGLWLTGFTLSGTGADMLLQGRTLSAELVPAYIRRLNAEPAFQGRSFASLSIAQGVAAPAAGGQGQQRPQGPAAADQPAPFLEFQLLASVEQSAAGKAAEVPALRDLGGGRP